jgi:hypothetical protein
MVQTTTVPALLSDGSSTGQSLAAWLTMANPRSLGWALEMWGYALLGIATWLAAPVFDGGRLEGLTRNLFVLNGPLSVAGGVATALMPGWVLQPAGLVAFGAWNVLIIAMTGLTIVAMRPTKEPL